MLLRQSLSTLTIAMLLGGGACLAQTATAPKQTLSLNQAIAIAQAHHPSMAVASASVSSAAAGLQQARAVSRPSITLAEDTTYSNDPVFAFGSKLRQGRFAQSDFSLDALNHPDALADFSGSATLHWTMFDAATKHNVAATKATLQAAELNRRYTAEELAARITALYYRALTAEDQIAVAQHALARAREVDASVADRVHSGMALETDRARADLTVRTAEDDLAQGNENVTLARQDLFALMDVTPTTQTLLRDEDTPADASLSTHGDLEQRLDMQALSAQTLAAQQTIYAAHAARYPKITTYGHAQNDALHVITSGSGNWTIGARVELSIFDGGMRRAQEQAAAAQVATIEAQRRDALLEANAHVRQLQAQIEDLRRRLATAVETIRVQQATLSATRDRYTAGLASLSDVLQAETDLTAAEFSRVRTSYQLRIASANLALATGSSLISKAGRP